MVKVRKMSKLDLDLDFVGTSLSIIKVLTWNLFFQIMKHGVCHVVLNGFWRTCPFFSAVMIGVFFCRYFGHTVCISCIFLQTLHHKVRPLCTLSHRGSDYSPLPIVFSANYINQSNRDFYATVFRKLWPDFCPTWHGIVSTKRLSSSLKYWTAFKKRYLIGRNHDAKYKVHTKFTWTRLVT